MMTADCKCAHCGYVESRRVEVDVEDTMTCAVCGKDSVLTPTLQGDFPFVLTRPADG